MSLVSDLIPTNLRVEQKKFVRDPSYNPQFTYQRDFSQKTLRRFGLPTLAITAIANDYLQRNHLLPPPLGKKLSRWQIVRQARQLSQQLDLPVINVKFRRDLLSRTSLRSRVLTLHQPANFDQQTWQAVLAHEIQTHYLRSINQEQQTFVKPKTAVYLATEEGLAMFNSAWVKTDGGKQRSSGLFITACRRYLVVAWAQELSFSQLFAQIRRTWHLTWSASWELTLRAKRGLTDTSKPGGFTKDIVYLSGFLEIVDLLAKKPQLYRDLYWGKISWRQLDELRPMAVTANLVYPLMASAPAADLAALARFCKLELVTLPA